MFLSSTDRVEGGYTCTITHLSQAGSQSEQRSQPAGWINRETVWIQIKALHLSGYKHRHTHLREETRLQTKDFIITVCQRSHDQGDWVSVIHFTFICINWIAMFNFQISWEYYFLDQGFNLYIYCISHCIDILKWAVNVGLVSYDSSDFVGCAVVIDTVSSLFLLSNVFILFPLSPSAHV